MTWHIAAGIIVLLPTEIDNHANTTCVGCNCRIEYYTPFECSVSPFLNKYQEQQNIHICTALTAAKIPLTGETAILRLGQCLNFHDKLQKTLINPNQLQAFRICVCDNSMDEHGALGIELDDMTFLPLQMSRFICGLMTWFPTNKELDSCCIFNLDDVNIWDPPTVAFLTEGNNRYSNVHSVSVHHSHPIDRYVSCNDRILPLFESLSVSSTITSDWHHGLDP